MNMLKLDCKFLQSYVSFPISSKLLTIMIIVIENEDGTLSGLRQFVTTKSHLKMMKNLFLYYVKSPFHS